MRSAPGLMRHTEWGCALSMMWKRREKSAPPPLHGMQLGAPPLKIIHLNSVLLGTSSSVQDVPSLPLRQHSSLLIPGMYSTWHLPFFPCCNQQFPAVNRNTTKSSNAARWTSKTADPDALKHTQPVLSETLPPSPRALQAVFCLNLFARPLTLAYPICDWQRVQCIQQPKK